MKKPSKKAIQKMSDALCDIDPLLVLKFDNYQKYVDKVIKERDYYKSLKDKLTFEETEQLYEFLMGINNHKLTLMHPPKLTVDESLSIIYYLQEHLKVIPNTYKKCKACGKLIDTDREGMRIDLTKDEEFYICENCQWNCMEWG